MKKYLEIQVRENEASARSVTHYKLNVHDIVDRNFR